MALALLNHNYADFSHGAAKDLDSPTKHSNNTGGYVELILNKGQDTSVLLPMLSQTCHAEDLMPDESEKWCALLNNPESINKWSLLNADVNVDRILQVQGTDKRTESCTNLAIRLAGNNTCSTIVFWANRKTKLQQRRLENLAKITNCQIISIRYRD